MDNQDFYHVVMAMVQSNLATYKALDAIQITLPESQQKQDIKANLDLLLEINSEILNQLDRRFGGSK